MDRRRKRIAVLQHRLLHYRTALFERLRAACDAADLDLVLVHGQATASELARKDTGQLPWAVEVKNRVWNVRGRDLLWQPMPEAARGSDLVVLMQENRLLSNYPWLFGWGPKEARVAFWGHGRNFQSAAPTGLRERWKQYLMCRVDWWFAYTEVSASIVRDAGYPVERITVLDNAIDNASFETDLQGVSDEEVAQLRWQVGAEPGALLGLYCGSLYSDKRLPLLVQAGRQVAARHPGFRLVVVGDGPSRHELDAAKGEPWLHWAGVQRGHAKAAWFKAAQLYLSPGAVGLHVLDSFVAGTPMITTEDALHGPEIAYLQSGRNGLITSGDVNAYAAAVESLIAQPDLLHTLRANAKRDAGRYTLDGMVDRFVAGMRACVDMPRIQ